MILPSNEGNRTEGSAKNDEQPWKQRNNGKEHSPLFNEKGKIYIFAQWVKPV